MIYENMLQEKGFFSKWNKIKIDVYIHVSI